MGPQVRAGPEEPDRRLRRHARPLSSGAQRLRELDGFPARGRPAILDDHKTFSNVVSAHLSVPNGMDPPEHTPFRKINERYFTPERMAAFEPACRAISRELVAALPRREVELMAGLAEDFANHIQCSFMGWPEFVA